jgi:endonuclease/exonuclease/phosphatase family metal-dependent hydrolase
LLHISLKQNGYWLSIGSFVFAAALLLSGCTSLSSDDQVTVLSFNIRYDNPGDGIDAWPNRSEWVASIIVNSGASIIGLQEALQSQLMDISSGAPQFAYVGVGRDDGKAAGEFSPILYDSTLWKIDSWETRWLSETPSEVGVAGWDAALPRIATIVDFRNVFTGKPLRVINTHFDHRGEEARLESAKLIASWANEGKEAVVILGDFNFEESDPPYAHIVSGNKADRLVDSAVLLGSNATPTFLGFDASNSTGPRIDYVFCNQAMLPTAYETLSPSRDGRYPSDHAPVRVKLTF